MRIGICEDCQADAAELKGIVQKVRGDVRIECFASGKELLAAMGGGASFDLLFLDIYLPDMKGTQLAQRIAGRDLHRPPYIVFVTTSMDHAVEAFALRAIHYIVKPVTREAVAEALGRIPASEGARQGIVVSFREKRRFVYLDEIAFCESAGHRIQIEMKNGESITCYDTLKNLQEKLGELFLQVTRGVLVNMDYIDVMTNTSCILKNAREILLSRRNLDQIHAAYNEFVFARLLDGT